MRRSANQRCRAGPVRRGRVVLWAALVATTMCLAGWAVVAVASTPGAVVFHPRFRMLSFTGSQTDGRYTLLSTTVQGEVGVVVDELTGAQSVVSLPADCPVPTNGPMLGGDWLLENCTTSWVDLYSLTTRTWRQVAVAPGCSRFNAGTASSCVPAAIGSDWIEYDESSEHLGDRFVFQPIVGGALHRDPTNARTVADVSSPRLARGLCAPLSVPKDGRLTLDGEFAVASGPAGVFLERCGRHLHLALGPAVFVQSVPGAIAWSPGPARSLDGILLPSLRRFRVVLPQPRRVELIDAEISDRHIYLEVLRIGSIQGQVWSAPLPAVLAVPAHVPAPRRAAGASGAAAPDANLVSARGKAARIMALLPLASDAARMTIDPHTGKPFAAPVGRGAWQVLASGHWLVPAPVADVVTYSQSHRPAGSRQTGWGSGSDGSWNEWLSFPTVAGAVTSASVEIDLTPYGASQTEFGAVVRVLWRPSWEDIPADTAALAVSIDGGRTLTVSGARKIEALRRVFARLSVVGPGAYSCPAGLDSTTARVDLLDRARRLLGGLNVEDVGCKWVHYRLGLRRGAPLWDNGILDLMWREGGALACTAAQLAATVTPVSHSGPTASMAVEIRNTSDSECSLDGFPGVELLTSQGSRLAIPIRRAGRGAAPSSATLATLAAGVSAEFTLSWPRSGPSCPADPVNSIAFRLPHVMGALTLPTPAPVGICRGPVTATPVYVGLFTPTP
jgi:uncharacterized protein DUF4232